MPDNQILHRKWFASHFIFNVHLKPFVRKWLSRNPNTSETGDRGKKQVKPDIL